MALRKFDFDRVRREARAIWNRLVGPDGQVDLEEVKAELILYIENNRDTINVTSLAADVIRDLDRALRPKAPEGQLSMFDAGAYIPIAEHERVSMESATRDHLMLWAAIDQEEHAASVSAYGRKLHYRASRLRAWRPHHQTLGQVEREVFNGE